MYYRTISLLIGIPIITVVLFFLLFPEQLTSWLQIFGIELIYAILLAIIAGVAIKYFHNRHNKSKMLKTTITPSSSVQESFAKLILRENQEFIIKEYERVFGREDFLGVINNDDLIYIGKDHFKITKHPDGYYIEDQNSKNGTILNGNKITGKGAIKLNGGDEIVIAQTLSLKYHEN